MARSLQLELGVTRWRLARLALRFSKEAPMADLYFILATLAFFGVSWLYVEACGRL